jgi:hypothetical protein
MRGQEPDRIWMIFRGCVPEQRLHPLPCGIVLAGSAPEIVVRKLEFFRFALLDPGLPEARDGVPVIGIERLFRFRQQPLAKGLPHRAILPRACGPSSRRGVVRFFRIRQCQAVDIS